jgi:hypothetical protein
MNCYIIIFFWLLFLFFFFVGLLLCIIYIFPCLPTFPRDSSIFFYNFILLFTVLTVQWFDITTQCNIRFTIFFFLFCIFLILYCLWLLFLILNVVPRCIHFIKRLPPGTGDLLDCLLFFITLCIFNKLDWNISEHAAVSFYISFFFFFSLLAIFFFGLLQFIIHLLPLRWSGDFFFVFIFWFTFFCPLVYLFYSVFY